MATYCTASESHPVLLGDRCEKCDRIDRSSTGAQMSFDSKFDVFLPSSAGSLEEVFKSSIYELVV